MSEAKGNMNDAWSSVQLSEVVKINPKLPIEIKDESLEVSFLPMKLVEEEKNEIHLTETRKYADVKKGFTPMADDDVIFAKITPCMENGKIAIVHSLKNGIAFGSTEFHVLRCNGKLINRFLFHYLVQKRFRNEAEFNMTGAVGQRRVPKKFLEEALIPLPSIVEQQQIVSKIEELFSELDTSIEQLKTAQQQLKIYRQSVLKWAFEGKLTNENVKDCELPKGWKQVRIEDIASVGTGATPLKGKKDYYENGRIPWVTSGSLNEEHVTSPTEFVTERALKETNLTVYPKHTLLLAMYGEGKTRGKCSELLIEATTNQAIAAIYFAKHDIRVKPLLKYFLLKNYSDIRRLSSGGVQPNLNLGIVKRTVLPFPPIEEQIRIVQEIESRFSVADKLEETITNSLQQAEALRQSILKKAFQGKLR
jgi:type I restriction enzyme, S subunit